MKMIVSDASRNKVYHRSGCMYETRISFAHRMTLSPKKAMMYGYHECSCCGGLKGFMKVAGKNLDTMGFDIGFTYLYDEKSDTLYLRTNMGFWKIFCRSEMRYAKYIRKEIEIIDPDIVAFIGQNLFNMNLHTQYLGAINDDGKFYFLINGKTVSILSLWQTCYYQGKNEPLEGYEDNRIVGKQAARCMEELYKYGLI